ncbi:MAG: hypothetical protein RBS88_00920 [Spongiibacteraceae bacterium]|jgi:hypothetical protein|nr:hypothetical protein [Spongiibacteraceae bacterium]
MAAIWVSLQRAYLPLLLIGLASGLLALIPTVGWLLGCLLFVLGWRYARRTRFVADALVVIAIWLLLQWFKVQLGG